MLTKEKILKAIEKMPDQFSIDELIDEILLIQKIENGLKQSLAGDVISDKELDDQLPEWLK